MPDFSNDLRLDPEVDELARSRVPSPSTGQAGIRHHLRRGDLANGRAHRPRDEAKIVGAWLSYGDNLRIGQGRENAKQFLKENPELRLDLG